MKKVVLFLTAVLALGVLSVRDGAAADGKYRIAWSHYTGWEPWDYAEASGILKKWADKYGIEIELSLVNDYIESINLYTTGQFDGCTMTNMDALTIPAVGGVDSSAIIIGGIQQLARMWYLGLLERPATDWTESFTQRILALAEG